MLEVEPRQLLVESFRAAVAAADPLEVLPPHLPRPPAGRTLALGAGKAAASMALAVESHWPAAAPLDGLVITRYRHGLLTNRLKVTEAGHPVPDESGANCVTGEASEVAQVYAALPRQIRRHDEPFKPPAALISGGECTVTVRGDGRGGRCTEFLLGLGIALAGVDGVHALAADTDGTDGTEDNAGAYLAPDSIGRAERAGLKPKRLAATTMPTASSAYSGIWS